MKVFRILSILMIFLTLSCGREFHYGVDPVDAVELDIALLRFPAVSGKDSISVSTKENWSPEVRSKDSWIHAERDGDILIVGVDANGDIFERSAIVKVKTANREVEVKVVQDPMNLHCSLSDTLFENIECNGATLSFDIESNVSWSIDTDNWLLPDVSEGEGNLSLSVKVSRNYSLAPRIGYIDFYHYGVLVGRVECRQSEIIPSLTIDKDLAAGITVPYTAFDETVLVTSSWRWTVYAAEEDAGWLIVNAPEAGTDGLIPEGKDMEVRLSGSRTKQPRDGTVYFSSAGTTISLPFHQEEIPTELSLSPVSIESPYTGGTYEVEINCNNLWTLTGLPDWISSDKTAGDEDRMTIHLTLSKNLSTARSAVLTVSSSDKVARINVTQEAAPETIKTFVFNGSDGYKALTPNLYTSSSSCYNLGVVERADTGDPSYKMEFYSRGLTLWFNATTGLRINPNPGSQSVTNQLRAESFAYIKFPALSGLAITKIVVVSANAVTDIYLTTTYGSSNANAISSAVSSKTSVVAGDNVFETGELKNIPYYLFMAKTSEYRFKSIAIHYIPIE